jgi:hypothetical protein
MALAEEFPAHVQGLPSRTFSLGEFMFCLKGHRRIGESAGRSRVVRVRLLVANRSVAVSGLDQGGCFHGFAVSRLEVELTIRARVADRQARLGTGIVGKRAHSWRAAVLVFAA